MTISVTIKVDANPPGTSLRVEHVAKLQDGTEAMTVLATIGAGQTHSCHLWDGVDVRLVEHCDNA